MTIPRLIGGAVTVVLAVTAVGSAAGAPALSHADIRSAARKATTGRSWGAVGSRLEDPSPLLELLGRDSVTRIYDAQRAAMTIKRRLAPVDRFAPGVNAFTPLIAQRLLAIEATLSGPEDRLQVASGMDASRAHAGQSRSPVGAILDAANANGVSFGFLWRMAQRESSLNPDAAAPTSSARGLFQFVDETWLATLKRYGAKHGRGDEARLIEIDGRGRPVAPPRARAQILALRYDPQLNARLAGELARENRAGLLARLGRPPTDHELYAAHLLGVRGAARLIAAARSQPMTPAASLLPRAARANAALFYVDGAPLTVWQVSHALGL